MTIPNASRLFVRCLENEGVEYIFGIPGEENLAFMDMLSESSIEFVTTRHEQGAAFMADVYGRLTGRAGVCLSTLGPGATNLITPVADANMDHAPLVAIAGQAATDRLHKESHQVLDLQALFTPITKYSSQVLLPDIIPEVVRKAFKYAQMEKTGACFIEFPENIASMPFSTIPLDVLPHHTPIAAIESITHAADLISSAQLPIILAGNGVIRAKAWQHLSEFAKRLNIPVANTFMAKGVVPFKHPNALGTVGLQTADYINVGFSSADVIICIGYDLVEYHPHLWHPTRDRIIIHIDSTAAEVDACYIPKADVIGDIKHSLTHIMQQAKPHRSERMRPLRHALIDEMNLHADDLSYPVKPQKIIWDLRTALNKDDIAICDVGAHKLWMARMFRCEEPNTCVISNGFASMGIAVPGAIAAKLAFPNKTVIAVTGDAGFLMNSQEIETALRLKLSIIILIWNDQGYGLIEWKQINTYGRSNNVHFNNPDFVTYAQSFGARGYRIENTAELLPTIRRAITDNTVCIIDCPVDYGENLKLTEKLGEMVCQI